MSPSNLGCAISWWLLGGLQFWSILGNTNLSPICLSCHAFLLDSTNWIVVEEESQQWISVQWVTSIVPNHAQSTTSCEARARGHSKNSLLNADICPIKSKPTWHEGIVLNSQLQVVATLLGKDVEDMAIPHLFNFHPKCLLLRAALILQCIYGEESKNEAQVNLATLKNHGKIMKNQQIESINLIQFGLQLWSIQIYSVSWELIVSCDW